MLPPAGRESLSLSKHAIMLFYNRLKLPYSEPQLPILLHIHDGRDMTEPEPCASQAVRLLCNASVPAPVVVRVLNVSLQRASGGSPGAAR
jgi:hypothetical protein